MLRRNVALPLAAVALAACSPTSPNEPTAQTLGTDDGEATLVTVVSTVPDDSDLPRAIAADVVAEVTGVVGVELEDAQTTCIVDTMQDEVGADALRLLGLGGDLTSQPGDVQTAIFGSFDSCVSPRDYGRVAAPLLTAAGAQLPVAQCVFRELRQRLGFAGMYAYSAGTAGVGTTQQQLGEQVTAAYDACDLDPATLSGPLGTPSTVTTTAAAPGSASTATSTTVVPPVAPPEDPIVTTSVSPTASSTTVASGTTTPRSTTTG